MFTTMKSALMGICMLAGLVNGISAQESRFPMNAVTGALGQGMSVEPAPVMIPEICQPDCPFTNWDGPYEIPALDVEGCIVKVRYWYRIDCNGNYDIQISRWNTTGGVCIADKVQLAGLIEVALLRLNNMKWPPFFEGGCNYTVRAVRASCYQLEFPSGDVVSCYQNNCCQSQYKICIMGAERIVTKTGQNSVDNHCDIEQGCRFYCPPD